MELVKSSGVAAYIASLGHAHNFSGGPGALPATVLDAVQEAVREVPGQHLSVLGISHRSGWFRDVVDEAEEHIRALLDLPDDFHVLFLQGGSTLQFAMIPLTLLHGATRPAQYLHTGYWSGKAIAEALPVGPVDVLWSGEEVGFSRLPDCSRLSLDPQAPYFHYVSNETVEGIQFRDVPGLDDVVRVADMSSDFLSRRHDAGRFGIIYAHAQKNLGPSGATVVLVRDDLLTRVPDGLPAMLDYRPHVAAGSIYNTPPVFAIYVTMLVLRWLREEIGGLAAMEAINRAKAAQLYGVIDASDGFYRPHAAAEDRSMMNVAFHLPSPALEARLLREAQAEGFFGLEGHRSLGGLRASLYNAVTVASVAALCDFMVDFRSRYA